MKLSSLLTALVLITAGAIGGVVVERYLSPAGPMPESVLEHAVRHLDPTYVCPMHSEIVADAPGSCPICGMDLVETKPPETGAADDGGRPVVSIDADMINNLGVRTAPVVKTTLARTVETPGFVQQIRQGTSTRYWAQSRGRILYFYGNSDTWFETGDALYEYQSEDLADEQENYLRLLAQPDPAPGSESREAHPPAAEPQTGGEPDRPAQPPPAPAVERLKQSRERLKWLGMSETSIRALHNRGEPFPSFTYHAKHPGRVLDLKVSPGQALSKGQILFELKGLVRATVLANAFQRDAVWVTTGQKAAIRVPSMPGVVWPGVVNQGAVSINPTTQNIGVKLSFTAPLNLVKSAMYVVATIRGEVKKDILAIPREAVMPGERRDYVVKALGNGRFKPVAVRRGFSADGQVEILEGLAEGDRVVTSAQFLIDSESSLRASFLRMNEDAR